MNPFVSSPDNIDYTYDLYAVLCHEGSISKGHYYTFAKNGDQWMWYNDQVVTEVREDFDVLVNPSAYVLFYRKRDTDMIRRQSLANPLNWPFDLTLAGSVELNDMSSQSSQYYQKDEGERD